MRPMNFPGRVNARRNKAVELYKIAIKNTDDKKKLVRLTEMLSRTEDKIMPQDEAESIQAKKLRGK